MSRVIAERFRYLLRSKRNWVNDEEHEVDDVDSNRILPMETVASSLTNVEGSNCFSPRRRAPIPQIYSGKTGHKLPCIQLELLSKTVCSSYSGPDGGLTKVSDIRQNTIAQMANLDDELTLSADETTGTIESFRDCSNGAINDRGGCLKSNSSSHSHMFSRGSPALFSDTSLEALGLSRHLDAAEGNSSECANQNNYNWNAFDENVAYGMSISLYERHPITGCMSGMPIADVFGIIARENNCVIALADGVNWGEGARLAARCAIRGAFSHMNVAIKDGKIKTTTDAFHELLGAFHKAHALILQEHGALTTLCVAFISRIRDTSCNALCVCSVGDSLCFVYSRNYGVIEVTTASHNLQEVRDMRDAGGALGPVDGKNPQLHNLTCSMSFVDDDDFVFITSDGVSDNFDPVVGKYYNASQPAAINEFCPLQEPRIKLDNRLLQTTATKRIIHQFHMNMTDTSSTNQKTTFSIDKELPLKMNQRTMVAAGLLPLINNHERHAVMLQHMAEVIKHGDQSSCCDKNCDDHTVTALHLCKNLIQYVYRLTVAKRKILENAEIYRPQSHSKTEERLRRQMMRTLLAEMPGKLDHASVVAYRIGRQKCTMLTSGPCIADGAWNHSYMNNVSDTKISKQCINDTYTRPRIEKPTEQQK